MHGQRFLRLLLIVLTAASGFSCCRRQAPSLQLLVEQYIEAANRHDIAAVRAMTSENATWHLGPYTLQGRDQMMRPLAFDEGANTVLQASHIVVSGRTVDFDLVERNDVLKAYGIPELHQFPRMTFRDGLIYRIEVRRPPLEQKALAENASSFRQWLKARKPSLYRQFFPEGQLNYSRTTGEQMPLAIEQWKRSLE
jgi:hypothetical protein